MKNFVEDLKLKKLLKEDKKMNPIVIFLIVVGVIVVIAAVAYALYRFFQPNTLEDLDDFDEFEDDFFIDDEMANIKSQLDVLNEAANTYLDFGFNRVGYIFTLVGAIFGVLGVSWLTENPLQIDGFPLIGLSCLLIAAIWLGVIFYYRRRVN